MFAMFDFEETEKVINIIVGTGHSNLPPEMLLLLKLTDSLK